MSPHTLLLFQLLLFLPLLHPLLAHPLVLPKSPTLRVDGQTFEPCTSSSDCLFPRICLSPTSLAPCTPPALCVCAPPAALRPCSTTADCPPGEACAAGLPKVSYSCVSARILDSDPRLRPADAIADTPTAPQQGLTLAQCRTSAQCRPPRNCIVAGVDTPRNCTPFSPICVCIADDGLALCDTSEQCPQGEVCTSGIFPLGDACASAIVVQADDGLQQVDDSGALPEIPSPTPHSIVDDGPSPTPDSSDLPDSRLTLDACRRDAQCRGPRLCLFLADGIGLTSIPCDFSSDSCLCAPSSFESCAALADCAPQEVCAAGFPLPVDGAACVSVDAPAQFAMEVLITPSVSPSLSPLPSPSPPLVLSPAPVPAASASPVLVEPPPPAEASETPTSEGEDLSPPSSTTESTPSSDSGFVASPTSINGVDTPDPEEPVSTGIPGDPVQPPPGRPTPSVSDDGESGQPPVPTPSSVPSEPANEEDQQPSEGDGATSPGPDANEPASSPPFGEDAEPGPSLPPFVCVDANALAHLQPEELVFEQHTLANVLCDRNGSCATPGHMVTFNGKVMMMRTYCEAALCERRVMAVNSPRYRRKLRVRSNTEGLFYTAFAARYASRGEELALSTLSRIGF